MPGMFLRDPFDIAPGASRHSRASWFVLALGVLFALAGAALLEKSVEAARVAAQANREAQEIARARAANDAAKRLKQSDPAAIERMRAQRKLQQMLRVSWSGLFDALEFAGQQVEGHATVLSLAPVKAQSDRAELSVTALAVSSQVMLDYMRALQKDSHVREVRLSSQQPAQNAGTPVLRFQLLLLWEPQPAPAAPAQAGGASASASQAGAMK
jgi:Tfp pilus assembly protein PilN